MSSKDEEKKIVAVMIIEVLGRPEKYLIETLEDIIKQISAEQGIKVVKTKIREPHLLKDQKDLFTSFAEIEVESDEILPVIGLTFKYMPSHIEIIEPEKFSITNYDLGDMLNEITRRLHRYEELVKGMQFQLQNPQLNIEPEIEKIKEKLKAESEPKGAKPGKKDEAGKKPENL